MTDRNNQARTEKTEQAKKSYSRPELVKHGNVESLTLGRTYGFSGPWAD